MAITVCIVAPSHGNLESSIGRSAIPLLTDPTQANHLLENRALRLGKFTVHEAREVLVRKASASGHPRPRQILH